jgi:hypothetical protein
MKWLLILGGVGVLVYLYVSSRSASVGMVATPPTTDGQVPGAKWVGHPPASPNITVTNPGTSQTGASVRVAYQVPPVKSLRFYQ